MMSLYYNMWQGSVYRATCVNEYFIEWHVAYKIFIIYNIIYYID